MVVDQETVIRFGPYNICNGSNWGLNLDLRGMAQANLDLGVFQDSKFTHGIHTLTLAGYVKIYDLTPDLKTCCHISLDMLRSNFCSDLIF